MEHLKEREQLKRFYWADYLVAVKATGSEMASRMEKEKVVVKPKEVGMGKRILMETNSQTDSVMVTPMDQSMEYLKERE